MNPFHYVRASDAPSAIRALAEQAAPARFLAGGTNLIDLMREGIERPRAIVDISRLPLAAIDQLPDGGVRIGAMVRNSHLAADRTIRERYPLLSQAILNGASAQLRNMATTGGNLMQRTRCYYFYDTAPRAATSGSPAAAATRWTASTASTPSSARRSHCIATHPSDMCVALAALDATVNLAGPTGARAVPFTDFHRLPGETPDIDTNLQAGELITSVDLPRLQCRAAVCLPQGSGSRQLRVRPGVGRRGVADRGWHDARRATRARRRGAQAVARRRRAEARAARPCADAGRLRPRRRRRARRRPCRGPATDSRLSWRNASIVAALSELAAGGAQ